MTKDQLKAELSAINLLLQGWQMDKERLDSSITLFKAKKESVEAKLERLKKKASKKR